MVQLANSSGVVTKTYIYDAFGVEKNADGSDVNPFRYCGEYWDKETNTYYLRARSYNPRLGRFTSEDPIRDGLNWYGYCNSNPVMFWDPWGLELIKYILTTGGMASIDTETGQAAIGGYNSQGRSWGFNTTVEKAQEYLRTAIQGGAMISYATKPPVATALKTQSSSENIKMFEAFFVTQSMQQMFFAMNYADLMYDTYSWAAAQDAITEAEMLRMSMKINYVSSDSVNWKTGDGYPKPPKWNSQWTWRYPESLSLKDENPRWFDPSGGEWRFHYPDNYHNIGHWDYNPWNSWNSAWMNVPRG